MELALNHNPQSTQQTIADEDADLLKKISEGDRKAFTKLYQRYQPRLLKFCGRLLKSDMSLAADIADEALIEVWNSAGSFSGRSMPSTWIHSIARFRLIGYLRKNKEHYHDDNLGEIHVEDSALLPDEEISLSERDTRLIQELGKLSDKHREVIELVYFRELPIKAISEMLNISENTVKTRMFYARKQLKSSLSNIDMLNI